MTLSHHDAQRHTVTVTQDSVTVRTRNVTSSLAAADRIQYDTDLASSAATFSGSD